MRLSTDLITYPLPDAALGSDIVYLVANLAPRVFPHLLYAFLNVFITCHISLVKKSTLK